MIFLQCEFLYAFSNYLFQKTIYYKGHILKCFFSSVNFEMLLQTFIYCESFITQFTFEWLFSSVNLQMQLQSGIFSKPLSQKSHLNDFSPVWIFTCLPKVHFCVNDLSQKVHLNGFSPE